MRNQAASPWSESAMMLTSGPHTAITFGKITRNPRIDRLFSRRHQIILTKHAIPYTIELLPWKRCLAELETGDKYLMALSASENPDRDKLFWFRTATIKPITTCFTQGQHPDGVQGAWASRSDSYRLGGIKGYAYSSLTASHKRQYGVTGTTSSGQNVACGRLLMFCGGL